MAVLADIRGRDVGSDRLARYGIVIVAGETGSCCLGMIKIDSRPACRDVAVFTDIRCLHMVGKLARNLSTIVATETRTLHLRMIHRPHGWFPQGCCVAILAGIGCSQVRLRLARHLRCCTIVVA